MSKPVLLDLFSGAGGCARGYQMAGFTVVGVDIKPQPRYAGDEFHQGDALEFVAKHGREFDAIHASPPCQHYSQASLAQRNAGKVYPDLIAPTRDHLVASGIPYVIENVPRSPMRADIKLCGCQFGLDLRRERWFETSWHACVLRPPCHHPYPVVSVVGHGTPTWVREKLGFNPTVADYRRAMQIDWMNRDELSQAIPPAYCKFVGDQLLSALSASRRAA